ncbi:MAG: hypothetical protein RMK20_07320, partial [Verrucomicrobiales bacterium]|nr:hypothetical protein [Verrucomicrobiales bacterium]
ECPIQIDTSTPSCGNSRFGCWTCTVVERDKASKGLQASSDRRIEQLKKFREELQFYQNPDNRLLTDRFTSQTDYEATA